LRRTKRLELLRGRMQFELGGDDLLHTASIVYLHQSRTCVVLMKAYALMKESVALPVGGALIPRIKAGGFLRRSL
jgi:hypothetical protein